MAKCTDEVCYTGVAIQPTADMIAQGNWPKDTPETANVPQSSPPSNLLPDGARGGPNIGTTTSETGTPASPTNTQQDHGIGLVASTSPSGGNNLSNGAVAGIAIATLIIGAAIAFLASFILFRKRTKSTPQNAHSNGYNAYADSGPELIMMQKSIGRNNSPYVQVSQTPAPVHAQTTPADPVLSMLPPLATDTDIQSKFAALFAKMHGHVDTYYRDVQANITSSMQSELEGFGAEDVDMAVLMQEVSDSKTVIKHALVAFVLGVTAPEKHEGCGGRESIFPRELLVWSDTPHPLHRVLNLHRRLSTFLYASIHHPPTLQPSARSSPNLTRTTLSLSRTFSLPFFPWAHPLSSDDLREIDLAQIISETLSAQIWVFGQDLEFEFRWDGAAGRGVVVWPWIVKRVDNVQQGDEGNEDDGGGEVVVEGRVV